MIWLSGYAFLFQSFKSLPKKKSEWMVTSCLSQVIFHTVSSSRQVELELWTQQKVKNKTQVG